MIIHWIDIMFIDPDTLIPSFMFALLWYLSHNLTYRLEPLSILELFPTMVIRPFVASQMT